MISAKFKPFAPILLPIILKSHPDDPLRLKSRENSRVEFKESFNLGGKEGYAKTMAAFANTSGGYLVFGVKDSPRLVCGLQNSNFEDFDPAKLTAFLNSAFSPEIEWEPQTVDFHGKKLGMLYVWELRRKPVVCLKTCGAELKEADIYYRYRGRSERIKYPELANLLEAERERERSLWREHLENISRIGVTNTAILDTTTGLVSGPGGSFLISEDLIPKLTFVREGMFQNKGQPTLKLIGDLKSIDASLIAPTETVVQHRPLHLPEVVMAFLEQRNVSNPKDYIQTICFSPTAYLPVRFFMRQANLSVDEAIQFIESVPSRQPSRGKLIDRLRNGDKSNVASVTAETPSAKLRKNYLDLLRSGKLDCEIPIDELPIFFQAVTHLRRGEFDVPLVLGRLRELFVAHYATAEGATSDSMRRAICHVDTILFG
jgi:hypothetical protein